jgi:PKD repeat protein
MRVVSRTSLALLVALGLSATPVLGQCSADLTCQYLECRSPAFSAPAQLWGELQPADVGQLPGLRDNSDWSEFNDNFDETEPHWESLDIENGWIFTGIAYGLQIWDARTTPANPVRTKVIGRSSFPVWPTDPHNYDPVRDLDAPPGNDGVVAMALSSDGGLVIFKTTDKSAPTARYADRGKDALQVYAGRIGSSDYAFTATRTSGLLVHNMTNAANRSTLCTEETPGQNGCGVYTGRLGTRTSFSYVDGAGSADNANHWVVGSSGGSAFGLELWKVSTPSSPSLVFSALSTEFVHGVALWRKGTNAYYLGMRVVAGGQTQFRVYNLSCLANNNCTGLGSPIFSTTLPTGGANVFVTDSSTGARDFIYLGNSNRCSQGLQDEWLFDVTTPTAPRDVTPPPALVNGQQTGYWGWYYRRNPTGFNLVNPRMGKFYNNYFYRAAYSLFDIHQLTTAAPTASFTYSPSTVYRGQPVSFTDQSGGAPTSFGWTFQGATPASSTQENPSGVVFNSAGSKSVTLTVSNTQGSDSDTQAINVLDPAAQVGSVSVSASSLLLCQSVSFTAQNVTGLAPVTLAWEVRNALGNVVATGGNVNPFTWSSSAQPAGVYSATVTASNGSGSDTATSPNVTVNALPTLAFTSPGSAPETLNGPPFGTGEVQFRIQSAGATEWRWSFGDGTTPVWTSDPVAGPQPTHSYAIEGTYSATVEIRNCQQSAIASNATSVEITNTTPLVAAFAAQDLFCTANGCFADLNVPILFEDNSQGTPQFWDYDWNGDGSWDSEGNVAPVTSHAYNSEGIFVPRLRIRRGTASNTALHGNAIIVGGGGSASVTVSGPSQADVGSEVTLQALAQNCNPAPTSWTWSVDGPATLSATDNVSSILAVFLDAGTRVVTAVATGGGCNGLSDTSNVTVNPGPTAVFLDGFEAGDTSAWGAVVP